MAQNLSPTTHSRQRATFKHDSVQTLVFSIADVAAEGAESEPGLPKVLTHWQALLW